MISKFVEFKFEKIVSQRDKEVSGSESLYHGVSSGPNITACQTIRLLSIGVPNHREHRTKSD